MKTKSKFLVPPTRALLAGACLLGVFSSAAGKLHAADAPGDAIIQAAFEKGTLAQGQQSLENALASQTDPNAPAAVHERYALAVTQFLRSAEAMGQACHH